MPIFIGGGAMVRVAPDTRPNPTLQLKPGFEALDAEVTRTPTGSSYGDRTTGWAGPDRLIREGWIDANAKPDIGAPGLVLRLDVNVGERDSYDIGFSANVIFRKQYYIHAFSPASHSACSFPLVRST